MSTSAPPLGGLRASRPFPERTGPTGSLIYRLITTTDHKMIGIMYVVAWCCPCRPSEPTRW